MDMTADAAMLGSTGAQRRRGPAFLLAGAPASEPARWLAQIMAEDRRRAGIDLDSDITAPPAGSFPPPAVASRSGGHWGTVRYHLELVLTTFTLTTRRTSSEPGPRS